MVKDEIHSILSDTRQLLEEKEFEKAEILYVLENTEDIKESISGVCDKNNEMYEVILKNKKVKYCYDWDYNVDEYIFGNIEKEYNIGFMTMEFHRAIWTSIGSVDIEEIQHKLGLQKYLKYCKDNNIDKDIIKRETKPDDIPDIMKFYDEKTNYVTMENGQVQMSNEKYQEQSDVSYIAFVLGYDLLNEMITNSEVKECDINYDFCNYLARKFIETDYYKDEWHSTYDNLRDWVEDNTDNIKSEHLFFTGKDNKVIIDTGKRNNEPVALVEHCFKDGTKEYIVAFNYKVSNEKVDWGYGYYYGNDLKKAKEDFEKVKAGGNLADTFKENKEEEKVMEDNSNKLQFYDEKEIRNIITNKEELYFADNGIDEVIIKFDDIPDFIVDINRKQGVVDLKFYKMGNNLYQPDITTMGEYLDKVKPEIREKIIDRLVKLQTGEIEPKEYKLIDENEFDDIKIEMEKEMSRKVKNKKKNREDR